MSIRVEAVTVGSSREQFEEDFNGDDYKTAKQKNHRAGSNACGSSRQRHRCASAAGSSGPMLLPRLRWPRVP
jgi:hypothetical protein